MFVLERLFEKRRQAQAQWHRDANKWVNNMNKESNWSRYEKSDYANKVPYPGVNWVFALQVTGIILGAALVLGLIVMAFIGGAKHDKELREATKPGMNCRMFNKGDYIKMTGGNYEGATGRVIGGCDKDHDYQVELSKYQKIDVGGDGTSELVDVSGKIIDEWNYQSITKIEEKK